jgi:flavorubredoxin
MGRAFEAIKVSEHVYWVGAVDWDIRDFHGYSTLRGSTYNAYLIVADDVILIDTVKRHYKDELLARVASVTDPKNIRYIISNHSEPDHSGSLPAVIEAVEPEKVFASKLGIKDLAGYYGPDGIEAVADGQTMKLGGVDLTFVETKMIHWPDSMMTYMPGDRLLFSQDGFGMHLATSERFADELPEGILYEESSKYFANILLPYKQIIVKLLDRIKDLGIPIDIIAPDHGPIWRKDLEKPIAQYYEWCAQKPTMKALVFFDTMWGSTEMMARGIEEGLEAGGCEVVVLPLKSSERSIVVTEVLEAGALLVGSPTINNNIFPSVADVLTYLRGLKPRNLVGAAFGSYGWSGEGARQVNDFLTEMKVDLVAEPLNLHFRPGEEGIEKCRQLGAAVAARLKEVIVSGA